MEHEADHGGGHHSFGDFGQVLIILTTYQFWPEAVDDLTFGVMKARF